MTHADQLGEFNGFLCIVEHHAEHHGDVSIVSLTPITLKIQEINLENATWKLANTLTSGSLV